MTRRSYALPRFRAECLIDPRNHEFLLPPRQLRRKWLIDSARIVFVCFAVTIGSMAVMAIAFALFWPAIEGILDIATRWHDGGYP
jgi:sterol desaturase/sphingolipid hydroxylase (fatty acid hydroxylase superfamily)